MTRSTKDWNFMVYIEKISRSSTVTARCFRNTKLERNTRILRLQDHYQVEARKAVNSAFTERERTAKLGYVEDVKVYDMNSATESLLFSTADVTSPDIYDTWNNEPFSCGLLNTIYEKCLLRITTKSRTSQLIRYKRREGLLLSAGNFISNVKFPWLLWN